METIEGLSLIPELSRKRCLYLCRWISHAENVYFFSEPVPWEELNILDYPDIISNPMDLKTLGEFVNSDCFSFKEFIAKSELIWSNACTYNPPGHEINTIAKRLQRIFRKKIFELQKHPIDDCSVRLFYVFTPLVMSFFQEDISNPFLYDCDCVNHSVNHSDIQMCIKDVLDILENQEYSNRFDIQEDMHAIFTNVIESIAGNSLLRLQAESSLSFSKKMFAGRHDDVDSQFLVTPHFRANIRKLFMASMHDNKEMMNFLESVCPYCIYKSNESTSISFDVMNMTQLLRIYYYLLK